MLRISVGVRPLVLMLIASTLTPATARAQAPLREYRVLQSGRTGAFQRELQEAADAGYRLVSGQGVWPTTAVLEKTTGSVEPIEYLLLSTTKSGTMQKEMNEASAKGYRFASIVGSETKEVALVMQRPKGSTTRTHEQFLLATTKISTMEQELREEIARGFSFVGQTLFERLIGGVEYVAILERPTQS